MADDLSSRLTVLEKTIETNHKQLHPLGQLDGIEKLLTERLMKTDEKLDDSKESFDQRMRHERGNRESAEDALRKFIDKKADAEVIEQRFRSIDDDLRRKAESAEFAPVRLVVYGLVALICAGFVAALGKLL